MAILLAVFSVHLVIAENFRETQTATTVETQLEGVVFSGGTTYHLASEQLEFIAENEQEPLSLSLFNTPFFNVANYSRDTFFWVLTTHNTLVDGAICIHKYYTKRLLFPFHTHL
jgi:hypothetical protein